MLDPTQYPNGHIGKATGHYIVEKTEKAGEAYLADEVADHENPYYKNPYLPESGIKPPPPPLSTRLRSYVRMRLSKVLVACIIGLITLFVGLFAGFRIFDAVHVQMSPGSGNHSARVAKKLVITLTPIITPTPTLAPTPTPVPALAPAISNVNEAAQVASKMQQIDPGIAANMQNLYISTPPDAYPNQPDMGTSYSCFGADHCTEFIIEVFSTASAMDEDIWWHKQNACDANARNCYYYDTSVPQQACLLDVPRQQPGSTVTQQDFIALEPIFEQACS